MTAMTGWILLHMGRFRIWEGFPGVLFKIKPNGGKRESKKIRKKVSVKQKDHC